MLIVMGPVLGVSVADLYAAAFGPGFLLAGMYLAYLMVRSFINPKLGPPVPKEERVHSAGGDAAGRWRSASCRWSALIGGDARLDPRRPGDADRSRGHRRARRGRSWRSPTGRLTSPASSARCSRTMATSSMVLLLAVTSNIFGAVFARLGTRQLDHRDHARAAAAADRDADRRAGPDLPARLAVRVAGDHPRVPADLLPGGRGAQVRPGLVRRAGRR